MVDKQAWKGGKTISGKDSKTHSKVGVYGAQKVGLGLWSGHIIVLQGISLFVFLGPGK